MDKAFVDLFKDCLRFAGGFGVYCTDLLRRFCGVPCIIVCGIVSHNDLIVLLLIGLLCLFFLAARWGFFRWSVLYRVLAFGRLTVFAF